MGSQRVGHDWACTHIFFYKLKKNWSIIVLQCCISFFCTMKWIRYTYTYIPSLLSIPPPPSHHRAPSWTPCAIQQLPLPCLIAQCCLTLCDPMLCSLPGSSVHGDSPGKNTGMGCHAVLQGIFPTQGSNPGLLHCRLILYQLSHQESPRILEWVAYSFSRGSFQPRNQTRVYCTAGGFFTSWVTREATAASY